MQKWIASGIALFWVIFFGIDYLWHHPYYGQALSAFPYWGALLLIVLVSAGFAILHHVRQGTWLPFASRGWRGITLWALLLVIEVLLFVSYAAYSGALLTDWTIRLPAIAGSIVSAHIFLAVVVIMALGLGHYLDRVVSFSYDRNIQVWLNLGVGFGLMAIVLFVLAVVGQLKGWLPWIVLLVLAAPNAQYLWRSLKRALWDPPATFTLHPAYILVLVAGLLLVAANLLGMNRPVPVGFDAINFYANIPHILSEEGRLVAGGQPYNWSLIMSLGFLGWESTRFALLLSVLPGILSLGVLYRLARLYLPVGLSLLVPVLFYALPMVTWQSTQEAKVDFGLLFLLLTALLALLAPRPKKLSITQLIVVIGFMLGMAIGVKFTALFAILGVGVVWLYQRLGSKAAVGGTLAGLGILFVFGLYRFAPIPLNLAGSLVLGGMLLVAGAAWMMYQKANRYVWRKTLKELSLLAGVILVSFSPWLIKNGIEAKEIGLKTLITGEPLYPELPPLQQLDLSDQQSQQLYWLGQPLLAQQGTLDLTRTSQEELRQEKQMEAGVYEEVARYMGYEPMVPRYLTIPYDTTMRVNVDNYVVDAGPWLWLLLPLLLLGAARKRIPLLLSAMGLLLWGSLSLYGGWLAMGFAEVEAIRGVMEQGHDEIVLPFLFQPVNVLLFQLGAGCYALLTHDWLDSIVAFLVVLLVFQAAVALALPQRGWLTKRAKEVLVFASMFFLSWWLMGSGIPWYGMLGFAIAPILLLLWIRYHKERLTVLYYLGMSVVGLSLFLSVLQRWTTPDPLNANNQQFLVPAFAQYTAGERDAAAIEELTGGKYEPALAVINAEPIGKILRFGTFINYYIRNNTERVYLDNQLNNFKYLYDYVEGDPDRLFDVMEALDIRYIVMSLNVGDDTADNLLGQKAELLMGFIRELFYRDDPLIRLIYTDQNDQQRGSYAAYELLYYE